MTNSTQSTSRDHQNQKALRAEAAAFIVEYRKLGGRLMIFDGKRATIYPGAGAVIVNHLEERMRPGTELEREVWAQVAAEGDRWNGVVVNGDRGATH